MSKTLYSVINPVVKFILNSPLHGLMSRNTVLLEFKGRKSGKTYMTPVSYHATDGHLHCFTDKGNKWWHNLEGGDDLRVTLRGRPMTGQPTVSVDGSARAQAALHDFLIASPRDAKHAGVELDSNGQPVAADVARASQELAFISIELRDPLLPTAPRSSAKSGATPETAVSSKGAM